MDVLGLGCNWFPYGVCIYLALVFNFSLLHYALFAGELCVQYRVGHVMYIGGVRNCWFIGRSTSDTYCCLLDLISIHPYPSVCSIWALHKYKTVTPYNVAMT